MGNTSSELRVDIVQDEPAFRLLKPEWEALAGSVTPFSPTQTFRWADTAWRTMPKGRTTRLAVITVRREGKPVLILPLFTETTLGIRVARQLGSGAYTEEYSGPLAVEDDGSAAVALLATSRAKTLADVLCLYGLPPGSAMAQALMADRSPRHREDVPSFVATVAGCPDWAVWSQRKSRSFRSGLRYDRSRLGKRHALSSVLTHGGREGAELVDWLFRTKSEWLSRNRIKGSWIEHSHARAFFSDMLAGDGDQPEDDGGVLGFGLRADGELIAASLCLRSAKRLEFFITGFDPAFSAYSPGNLLIEDCVKWALQAGVDFDMRLFPSSYKERWMDREENFVRFVLATSARGWPFLLRPYARSWAQRARALVGLRTRLRSLLTRVARPPGARP